MRLFLGIDLGTSGIRCAVLNAGGAVLATSRAGYPGAGAPDWWDGVAACLDALPADLDRGAVVAAAICGTSGSMVLTDADLTPVTAPLMYDSHGFDAEAATIAQHAPPGHITRGSNSALARMLRLQALDKAGAARHLLHQADFVLAHLRGGGGLSDDTNALKTGHDPVAGWPGWMAAAGVRVDLLPRVLRVGDVAGTVAPDVAARFGFAADLTLIAGATDSTAAFLATGANRVGDAVTSLGTTLAIKLMSRTRIEDASRGIYSHRVGDDWLAGGASNTGGGVLAGLFSGEEIVRLSARIDPATPSLLDYHPLRAPGERFPVNDPGLPPRMTPRPDDDAAFLHGLLEGMARIEAQGYAALHDLGGPPVGRLFTAGGGAANSAWTAIRARVLGVPMHAAPQIEASIGMADLARRRFL